jgi:hypothetical protein
VTALAAGPVAAQAPAKTPKILVIMGDDVGWFCGIGFLGGQCLSLGGYVTGTGARGGDRYRRVPMLAILFTETESIIRLVAQVVDAASCTFLAQFRTDNTLDHAVPAEQVPDFKWCRERGSNPHELSLKGF